uniref:Bifunctional inhibitor/plant lipid transfer protein/seed storage helical domain-containing protein n=1 Tax=Oryza rufipogon TaxID=4529 RepID=A0A0E0NYR3_ORYRU
MVVIAAVMLAAAAPAPAPAGTTCEQLESVARSCTGYLKRSLIFLNDACCDGAESVYDALTTDAAVDLGFVCRCLRGFVISESLRPYLYRVANLPRLWRDESRQRMFDHLGWGVPDRAVDC